MLFQDGAELADFVKANADVVSASPDGSKVGQGSVALTPREQESRGIINLQACRGVIFSSRSVEAGCIYWREHNRVYKKITSIDKG